MQRFNTITCFLSGTRACILNFWIEIQTLVPERKHVAGLNLWIEIQALVRER
jgi:hypothetical protein